MPNSFWSIPAQAKGDRFSKGTVWGYDGVKGFAVRVIDAYAQNFKREGVYSQEELVWFAKLESYRYYNYNDPEIRQCIKAG